METGILFLVSLFPALILCNPLLHDLLPFTDRDDIVAVKENGRMLLAGELYSFKNSFFHPLKGKWTTDSENSEASDGVLA